MHAGVLFGKNNFSQNDSCENSDNFSLVRLLYMARIDGAIMGQSTSTTAFDGAI